MCCYLNVNNGFTKWDKAANLCEIELNTVKFEPPLKCTYFSLDDNGFELQLQKQEETSLCYKPVIVSEERAALIRSNEKFPDIPADLSLLIFTEGSENVIQAVMPQSSDKKSQFGMSILVPDSAVIHLAEFYHTGRKLDKDMEVGFRCESLLKYNMMVIELDGLFLRFRTEDETLGSASAKVWRHDETFSVTFLWRAESRALIGVFNTLVDAVNDFTAWAEAKKGLRKLKSRSDVPMWIHDIKLVITVDMMRSNWEIAHDYNDVINMGREIMAYRDPREILFYIPGWQGAYDSSHPSYLPSNELGGREGFKAMMDQLKTWGYHVMIHTTVNGIDPYLEDIDLWEKSIRLTKDGKFIGWQLNKEFLPPVKDFAYRTGRIPLKPYLGKRRFKLPIGYVPGDCAAYITIGGVSNGKGRIRLYHQKRPIISPVDWFARYDFYDYIYPLQFMCGFTEIEVEISDDAELDIENAWLQVRIAYSSETPYTPWTYPIMLGDENSEFYVTTIAENIKNVVEEFDIDAVHIDAASFYVPFGHRKIYHAIRNSVPVNKLIACEFLTTWEELDFHVLIQSATLSLAANQLPKMCTKDGGTGLPLMEGILEKFEWLNKTSPICDFSQDYIYCYPHLCAANAFVPVKKVCNILPARKLPLSDTEHWRTLRDSKRLRYIPGLRLNYREYGLDTESIKALRELQQ